MLSRPRFHLTPRFVAELLSLTRALWAARADAGAPLAELDRIRRVGQSLTVALDLAACEPGSMGQAAAQKRVLEAVTELGRLAGSTGTSAVVRALWGRVSGKTG